MQKKTLLVIDVSTLVICAFELGRYGVTLQGVGLLVLLSAGVGVIDLIRTMSKLH